MAFSQFNGTLHLTAEGDVAPEDFKLPGSSLDEIEKILESYAQKSAPSSNDEIGKLAGTDKTQVSRNNGFLASLGLIEGGHRKAPTDLGRRLGLALHHQQHEEMKRYWQQAVAGNSFLSEQLTAIRVQKGVKVDDLPGRIIYNARATKNKNSEAGAKAIAEIFEKAGLLQVENGKYVIAKEPQPMEVNGEAPEVADTVQEEQVQDSPGIPAQTRRTLRVAGEQAFSVAINLQLQLPEFEDTKKYEDLFRALREHLLSPPKSDVS